MTGQEPRTTALSAGRRELIARLRGGPAGSAAAARRQAGDPDPRVSIKPGGDRPPLFLAPAVSGSAYAYAGLARLLHPDQPADSFEAPGLDGQRPPLASIEQIAGWYAAAVRRRPPPGPYRLAGWSFGGTVAFEMAHQLAGAGIPVGMLVVIDGAVPGPFPEPSEPEVLHAFLTDLAGGRVPAPELAPPAGAGTSGPAGVRWLAGTIRRYALLPDSVGEDFIRTRFAVFRANMRAHHAYRPRGLDVPAVIIRGEESAEPWHGWRRWLPESSPVRTVPGDHYSMWSSRNLPFLAAALQAAVGTGIDQPSDR